MGEILLIKIRGDKNKANKNPIYKSDQANSGFPDQSIVVGMNNASRPFEQNGTSIIQLYAIPWREKHTATTSLEYFSAKFVSIMKTLQYFQVNLSAVE
jgi:hypothetical protein